MPADIMLPERRLEELVEQALVAQMAACAFHNSPALRPSLLTDYACGTEQIPTCTTQVRRRSGGAAQVPFLAASCRGMFAPWDCAHASGSCGPAADRPSFGASSPAHALPLHRPCAAPAGAAGPLRRGVAPAVLT